MALHFARASPVRLASDQLAELSFNRKTRIRILER